MNEIIRARADWAEAHSGHGCKRDPFMFWEKSYKKRRDWGEFRINALAFLLIPGPFIAAIICLLIWSG